MGATRDRDGVQPPRVVVEQPDRASLLALLVRRMLLARATDPRAMRRIGRMHGDVRLSAGEMTVGLRFESSGIRIVDAPVAEPNAWIKGDVATLLQLVSGRFDLRRLLAGRLRVGGDPRMLLRLWTLLRAVGTQEDES